MEFEAIAWLWISLTTLLGFPCGEMLLQVHVLVLYPDPPISAALPRPSLPFPVLQKWEGQGTMWDWYMYVYVLHELVWETWHRHIVFLLLSKSVNIMIQCTIDITIKINRFWGSLTFKFCECSEILMFDFSSGGSQHVHLYEVFKWEAWLPVPAVWSCDPVLGVLQWSHCLSDLQRKHHRKNKGK